MNFKTSLYTFIVLTPLILVLNNFGWLPLWVIFLPLTGGILLISLGAFHIQWNFFLKAYGSGQAVPHALALTFDDGPHPVYTPRVLKLLEEHHIKATFFCIGKNIENYPALLLQIHHAGHIIGNHSYSHRAGIGFSPKKQWLREMEDTDMAIGRVIALSPRFFRPPFGVTTPHLAAAIKENKKQVIGWQIRPYDTLRQPVSKLVDNILSHCKAGDIILLHDTHERIIPVLEQLLPLLKARNFTFTTVDQLLQCKAYGEV